MGLFGFYLY